VNGYDRAPVPRYYVTVGPEDPGRNPGEPTPTWFVDAVDESTARDRAELEYRREHPGVGRLRVRITADPSSR